MKYCTGCAEPVQEYWKFCPECANDLFAEDKPKPKFNPNTWEKEKAAALAQHQPSSKDIRTQELEGESPDFISQKIIENPVVSIPETGPPPLKNKPKNGPPVSPSNPRYLEEKVQDAFKNEDFSIFRQLYRDFSGIGITLFILVLIFGAISYSEGNYSSSDYEYVPPEPNNISYFVHASSQTVDITIENEYGGTSQFSDVPMWVNGEANPWWYNFTTYLDGRTFLYVSAQIQQDCDCIVRAIIYIDGVRAEFSQSEGAYVIASASDMR